METHSFQADAQQILRLVTHSIYSDREVFFRELLSNASDALDKARFLHLQDDSLKAAEGEAGIRVSLDSDAGTITIEDDGVGMTREELVANLGTIAQSGTKSFAEKLSESDNIESLIGQFGVGFYSSFMVADKVEVESMSMQKDAEAVRWVSDGGSTYSVETGEKESRGTRITLHVRDDAKEYLEEIAAKGIIQKHSDFIQWPILLGEERINQETALWLRDPKDITEEEYHSFYRHISKDWQDPLCYVHLRAEGTVQFNSILFVPKKHSYQLDNMNYKVELKLYQKRVKVLENANELLPRYLRFVAGVVDSPDVELNVSREILQQTSAVNSIQKQLAKKILRKLEETAQERPEEYNEFWKDMGYILKEGIPDDEKRRKDLVKLFRCTTTKSDGDLRSLGEVAENKIEGQDAIWYLTDVNKDLITSRPILEGFAKRDWEVMLLTDPVDEWVVMSVQDYEETPLKSVAHGDIPEEEAEEGGEGRSQKRRPSAGELARRSARGRCRRSPPLQQAHGLPKRPDQPGRLHGGEHGSHSKGGEPGDPREQARARDQSEPPHGEDAREAQQRRQAGPGALRPASSGPRDHRRRKAQGSRRIREEAADPDGEGGERALGLLPCPPLSGCREPYHW